MTTFEPLQNEEDEEEEELGQPNNEFVTTAFDDDIEQPLQTGDKIGSPQNTNLDDTSLNDVQSNNNNNNDNSNKSPPKIWNIEYYQPYFDVNTQTELYRLKKSLIPIGPAMFFNPEENEKPDLYGPVWIVATLSFLVACMASLAQFFAHKKQKANEDGSFEQLQWDSAIKIIGESLSFLYICLAVCPVILYFILRGNNKSLVELISLYGYSYTPYLYAAIICVFRFSWLQWLIIGISMISSIKFLTTNIYFTLPEEKRKNPGYYVLAVIFLVQVINGLVFKLHFFKY